MAQPPAAGSESAGWVIDASVTMPWFFPDEATPFTETLLDALGAQAVWAPSLWVLECTNVLPCAGLWSWSRWTSAWSPLPKASGIRC